MHTIDLWRWRLTEDGLTYTTRALMSEADARAIDPDAERVPGSRELREVPDDPGELRTQSTTTLCPRLRRWRWPTR